MPILPIIDLLIFSAWSVLSVGAVLKLIYVTTQYRPSLFGLGPFECLLISGILLLLSLSLSARTWVKAQEVPGQPLPSPRVKSTLDAYAATRAATRSAARETLPGDEGGAAASDGRAAAG